MLIEEHKVEVAKLRPGMFVSRLDRDWVGTPFLLQGFLADDGDVALLRECCSHVYIDVRQSLDDVADDLRLHGTSTGAEETPAAPVHARPRPGRIGEDMIQAEAAVQHIAHDAAAIIDALRAGEGVSHAKVTAAVEPVVASVVRNPDAFFWLQALRRYGDYAYSHAVNCCALSVALGRQLGLPAEVLRDLAAGGLLLDIGMTAVPQALLDQPGPLSEQQHAVVRSHVGHGVELYRAGGAGEPTVIAMMASHHERQDGSGYPHGLNGDSIPLYARIAAIVDSYDAMTSGRPHRPAMPRHDALQAIYRERGRLYQDELIEQFMQCLGVYPVGSLVELNSGEVAVVMAQNPIRRLRPVLMMLTTPDKQLRPHFEQLDLVYADRGRLPQASLAIVRGLPPGAYGLEPSELYL